MLADSAPAAVPAPHLDYADFVRQRKDDVARGVREQRERSLRIADGIADAQVRRAFLKAEADHERDIADFWRRFFRRVRKQRDGLARQVEGHLPSDGRRSLRSNAASSNGPSAPPSGAIQLAGYSGPVLDRKGRRGVYLSASYLSSKTATYGCARRLVRYVTDAAQVEWLDGTTLCGSNVGDSRSEISAAFGLVEDLNRAARANAKIVFHLIVQLPHDVTPAARAEIMRTWCEDQFGVRNLPYAWAVHTPDSDGDQRNFHGHVAVSFRPLVRVEPCSWDAGRELKAELDNPEQFRVMREQFARVMTEVVQKAGKAREYTALSHAARGLKIKPTEHLGAHKTRLVREGKYVSADARNRARIRSNEAMLGIARLKRRRAAMERRLARVRQIEARSAAPVKEAPRPSRMVSSEARRATAAGRPHWSRPAVAHPTAARRHVTAQATMDVPALASRLVNPASAITAATAALDRNAAKTPPAIMPALASRRTKQEVLDVTAPAAVVRALTGTMMRSAVVAAATRATSEPAVPTPAIATCTKPDPSTCSAVPTVFGVPRPVRSHIQIDAPTLSSRPQRPEAADIVTRSSVRSHEVGTSTRITVPVVICSIKEPRAPSVAPGAVSAADRPGRAGVTQATLVRGVSRGASAARPVTRGAAVLQAARAPAAPSRIDLGLLDSAFGERAARRRLRAQAGAPRAVLAAAAAIDWGLLLTDDAATLDQLEPLDQVEPLTPASTTAITERVRALDFYVHDDGTGRLDLDPRAMIALGVTDMQLGADVEQAALTQIRRDQERAFAYLVAEAQRRPLDFNTTGPKPWPRNLDQAVLNRLDRWSRDEGFRADLFSTVEQPVREAHNCHERIMKGRRGTVSEPVAAEPVYRLPMPIPDGFGGWRDTAPPVFEATPVEPRVRAFDKATGMPSRSLHILLHYCGEHPRQIAFATDGRLIALPGTPKLIDPLVGMWRHDNKVQALVVETVTASREAGRAVWPARHAASIRASALSLTRDPPVPGDLGTGR